MRASRSLSTLLLTLFITPVLRGASESPLLRERVARGDLPPLEQRLPETPAVVEPVSSIGKYGGTWRRLAAGVADLGLTSRLGYEPLVRWDRSGRKVIPGVAKAWEILDDGMTYVFHLRKGMKWSDGAPFTSEDALFWYDDILKNKELSPLFPSWLKIKGEPIQLSAPDPETLVFSLPVPHSIFLELLAFQGNIFMPKHYLRQFHPAYTDKAQIESLAHSMGYDLWYQVFGRMSDYNDNPDLPTWRPFKLETRPPAQRLIAARNPFYWKVDPEGQQLPYLDEIAYTDLQNGEMITLKAMAGEADFQERRIDAANYRLFMDHREKGRYHVLADVNAGTAVLYVNQWSKDEGLRPVLRDRRFRMALSLAINRPELIFLLFSNRAMPSRGIASPQDPYYLPEFDSTLLDYDPDRARALLDEMGMTQGPSGTRRLPDKRPFRQILHVFPSETGTGMDLWQLVADYFREVGLDFVVSMDSLSLSGLQARNGNSDFWGYATAGLHWVVDPMWYVPVNRSSYFAPLVGRYVETQGKDSMSVPPPHDLQRLLDLYQDLCATVGDEPRKLELGQSILRQWSEECYTIGICREPQLTIVSDRFRNVPEHILHDYRVLTPGYIGIEQFYIEP